MKITKEQKERILKLDPDFFDEKFEVGVWYKGMKTENTLVFKVDNCGYGFFDGSWSTLWAIKEPNNWTKATTQEVETALIEEAKRRGYKNGIYVKPLWETPLNNWKVNDNDIRYFDNTLHFNCAIFDNGKWAEIIPTYTQKEAEEKFNIKIV